MSCYKLGDNCFVVCRFCAFTLEKRVDYHEHVHEDHFYCIKCKLGFSTIKGFRKHLACSSNHQFCCVTCHLDFTTSKALMQHFKSFLHLNNPGAVVKCPECGSIFNKPLGLAMHLERPGQRCAVQLHQQDLLTAIKLWEEYSGNCGLLTRSVENESPHQTLRSNVESLTELGTFATERSRARCTYVCHLCQMPFTKLNSLNMHLNSPRHELEDPTEKFTTGESHEGWGYVCFLCFKLFKDLNGLNNHINSSRHEHEEYDESVYDLTAENFHCKGCGKRCKRNVSVSKRISRLPRHLIIKLGTRS
ncbi:hypothetical protein O6H91_11G045000 [Diphasiastrum complanatum]|uniref:Uncharacterized protein n=1 Tax=Diphasiastrum complanatum TaxID=34168 RepID=A0ACC2C8J6_DIPCM|nr:hypothetical protein O6H91_11G045000 [Diphasiastrum complanatum]